MRMEFGNQFEGRRVVLTGAAGLFGSGLAKVFAAHGARLCLTDRNQHEVEKVLGEIDAPEGSFAHAAELTEKDSMQALVDAVGEKWGAADIVINNAAIYPSGFMLDIELEDWDRMQDINVRAPYFLIRQFARQMIDKGVKGNFINIGSGASRKMRLTAAPYCISKSSLDRLTKAWAQELAQFGIRVNILEPGFSAGSAVSHLPEEHVRKVTAAIPLGRASTVDDIGPAALYLASDAAAYVTGTTLTVDGGNSLGSLEVFQDKKRPL